MERGRAEGDHPLSELFNSQEWKSIASHLGLTAQQVRIARLICLGYTNPEIAVQIGRAPETVGMHTRGVFQKLGVHHRVGVPVRLVLVHRRLRRRKMAGGERGEPT